MRLTDLNPQWLYKDGVRVGFIFMSPIKPEYRQTCFAVAGFSFKEQMKIVGADEDNGNWQACKKDFAWTIEGGIENADFETLTVTPSLDGSAGGLWHGFITKGEICGGLPH